MNAIPCTSTFDPLDCHGHITHEVGEMGFLAGMIREVSGSGLYAGATTLCDRCGEPAWKHKLVWRREFHDPQIYKSKSGAY